MSVYVDIAVAVILVFFTLSLVVTALNEALAVLSNARGRLLREGLRDLLADDGALERILGAAPVRAAVTARSGRGAPGWWRFPDRLPPLAVADALLAAPSGAARDGPGGVLLAAAHGAAEDARDAIAAAYDDAMVQLSVRYKRRRQLWSAAIGVAVAAAFNVDVLALANSLRTDAAMQAAFAAYLDQLAFAPDPSAAPADFVAGFEVVADEVENLRALSNVVGFGWAGANPADWETTRIATALAGWLVAGLATVLGAPFWFDLLNRALRARGAIRRAPEPAARP